MIINFYLPDNDAKLIDKLKSISGSKRRSFSFVVREALEYYLLSSEPKSETNNPNQKREA